MKRKTTKKLLAVLMIISILATDFFVLGSGLITYAAQINSETSNSNIEFSSYFKNEAGERVDSIEESIKNQEIKLYVEVKVKNEGYFNGVIEIQNSNFNIKNEILSPTIASIDGNKINLKQVNYGESEEIELGIEPIISDKISADMLSKTSTVKLTGTYIYSKNENGESIQSEKTVCINFQPDEIAKAELDSEIITNKIFSVNGINKRIVQILIKSRLTENQYPVEQTKLNVNVPKLSGNSPEEIKVLATGKLATNGATEISPDNWSTENDTVTITIENKSDANNEITWNKNSYDELIVTAIYTEDVDISASEITTELGIKLHNTESIYTATNTKTIENQELNSTVIVKTENVTKEMYKGKLYANITSTEKENIQYETKNTIVITNADIADKLILNEETDLFVTGESELETNSKYITTEINKEKMLKILGQEGNIEIKNGETTTLINKDSEANESGNVVINHPNSTTKLDITTSKPIENGLLEIRHIKDITENTLTKSQLKNATAIKNTSTISATLEGVKIAENITEASIELKETISKAELIVDRENLSTTETNEVTLGVKLITYGEQYDLYKNPTIRIQLPSTVENVEISEKLSKLYADEFEVNSLEYNSQSKIIEIKLEGEQTAYPESTITQLYLQLNLNITLSKLATSQTENITMTYTNENASQYDGGTTDSGVFQQSIGISAPTGLIKVFNLISNEDISTTQKIKQQVEAGDSVTFEMAVINNTDADINDVKILGKLPTTGNGNNTLETTLQENITSSKGTVYYTENANAIADIEDATNGWTTDLLTNAKLYLIKLEGLSKGDNCIATVKVQLPTTIKEDAESYTNYEVIYGDKTEMSREIWLDTDAVSDIDVKLTAQVGQDTLKNGDSVKEGEVIRYTVTVINNSTLTIENIELKTSVPEGTEVVKPIEDYEYLLNMYYEEKSDINELVTTIPTLLAGQEYTIKYEVRVKKDIVAGTEISNAVKAIYYNVETTSESITNKIEESNIRVTIKKAIDESIKLTSGSQVQYDVIIENLSNEIVNGLEIEIISDNFIQESGATSLEEIQANSKATLKLSGKIKDDAKEMQISAIVKDSQNTYKSNVVTENLLQTDAKINLTTPQNNAYLKEGDVVEYNIVVTNTGAISEYFKVYYSIPQDLTIQSVSINGETISQTSDEADENTYSPIISNLIYEGMTLEAGQSRTIDIIAKVKKIEETKIITNTALVEVLNVYKGVSQEIKHTLLPSEISEEDTKNIISGSAWLDTNANGQKDKGEAAISKIQVKLYNTLTNSYLENNYGIITATTDANGEYAFTKIPNGSYIVVFEYDMKTYEPTTYLADGVDIKLNSKAILKNITVDNEIITVAGTETIEVKDNISYINIGLKDKSSTPSVEDTKRTITGQAWLDENKNGQKDDTEKALSAIKVKVYDVSTSSYLKDVKGNIVETTTNSNGEYYLTNIEKGSYIVIFEYDTEKYELTTYLAEGVDSARSSKVILNKININGQEVEVASTDLIELQENVINMNIGLREKGDNANPKIISGLAWIDANRNGQKDAEEKLLQGVKVKIYDVSTKNYLKNENGNVLETETDYNGKYIFNNIEKGSYILIFEYNTEKYEPTIYLAEGVATSVNSKVVLKNININGQEITAAVTDTINVQTNILNINIGLKEKLIYDLELNKYISRIVVQTSKETKAHDYENETFAKVEIHRKQIQGALVVLEYTIKVKNSGEVIGYAKNIVDYLPSGLTFNSELNKDWYLSGDYLHTKSLENVAINPGEEKEIKLILTKIMTTENTGLINNRAEIEQDYNQYGEVDRDSTPNNQAQGEDDYGNADTIILVSTGGSVISYIILVIINIALIGVAIRLMTQNGIIRISTKEERR